MITLLAVTLAVATMAEPLPNTLSPAEHAAGWKLLFDGTNSPSLRAYRKEGFPWAIEDAAIKVVPGKGDIVTLDQYADFEFQLEWKATPKANSGIIYRVAEKNEFTWMTGPEFQILDDAGHAGNLKAIQSAGAMYDFVEPPADKVIHPAGQWNHARIWVKDGLVKHFINGQKTAEVRIDGQGWKDQIAKTKFAPFEGFGVQANGHIAIQDHGDILFYRNIKVRDLSSPAGPSKPLFDGQSLAGWTAVMPSVDPSVKDPASVWTTADGTLVSPRRMLGYLRTNADYTRYLLTLQWRWDPTTKRTGNSGVLLAVTGEEKVWPSCLEAQLMHQKSGDFWNIGNLPLTSDPARTKGGNVRAMSDAERPVGEWNEYQILVDAGSVTLNVNGELVNSITGFTPVPGKIALQAEGTEIHFRDIRITPLD